MFEEVYQGDLSCILKIGEGLFFREGNHELRNQSNTGIVELSNSLAIIDYPEQQPDEEIINEAELLLSKPVRYIIITHPHRDHVAGLRTLHRQDISIIAGQACIMQLRAERYPLPPVYQEVTESTRLRLDGVELNLILPGRVAHSPWDLLVGVPQYGAVFTGDMVARERTMYFHSSDIAGWRIAIDELQQQNWKLIGRGHGAVTGPDYLEETAIYLALLEQAQKWKIMHNETVTAEILTRRVRDLSPALRHIVARLLQYADPENVARQINQLMIRSEARY